MSQQPGEWFETKVESTHNRASVLVSEKKLMKGKVILARIMEELRGKGKLYHKQLERDRGFLIYSSRT